jgi:hypothetical protein
MDKKTVVMRDDIIDRLNLLVRHTEEIYLNLARTFPELLKEMEKSIAGSSGFVEEFRGTGKGGKGKSDGLNATIKKTKEIIDFAGRSFSEIQEKDNLLFTSIEKGIQKLSALDSFIARIHEDSEEMELISLNAMTVALKAGSAGRAFSYITEELKRLSSSTIGLTEDLTRHGKQLLSIFHVFQGLLGEAKGFQENLYTGMQSRLRSSFDDLSLGMDRMIQALSDLIDRSTSVREPLMIIMEEIQLQDIIRQSVDHVIISLMEFKEISDFGSAEELLDELSFFNSLPDLCILLLDDVKKKIQGSIRVFHDKSEEAREIIASLETERQNYIRTLQDNSAAGSLAYLFENSSTALKDLLNDLSVSIRYKERITSDSRQLTGEVSKLERTFKIFETIVSRFHSVDIASRIEVAKQEILRKMTDTVEEMTALTARIENDVKDSLKATKEFINTISASVNDYAGVFQKEEEMVRNFESSIRESYEILFQSRETVNDSIAGFSLFTGKFVSRFTESRKQLDMLSLLLEDIEMLKGKLREIKHLSELEMETILARLGKKEWSIENKKLQEIIKRFTIFTHKRTAGDLGGFAVESGVESGDITLF